jgi:LmbE family N-acetylglucosaminyl deacetylase
MRRLLPKLDLLRRRHLPRGRRRRLRWLLPAGLLFGAFLLTGGGLLVAANWQGYLENLRLRQGLPVLPVPDGGSKILVVAPHPDDEVLGNAGLIQQALGEEAQVYVVLMTNGDASEMSLLYEHEMRRTPAEYLALGRRRVKESLDALSLLGVGPDRLFTLGFPNGGLDLLYRPPYWRPATPWTSPHTRVSRSPYAGGYDPGADYCGEQVVADLAKLIRQLNPNLILTSAACDHHPDHWATWGFTALAAEQAGWLRTDGSHRLYGYLVHRADWPAPRRYLPQHTLAPPAALADAPGLEWYSLPLTPEQAALKARAVRAFKSQGPHWDPLMLALVRGNELFVAPDELPAPGGRVVLRSPVADTPTVRQYPGGDLATVAIGPGAKRRPVLLTTAARIDRRLTYSVLGHGLRGQEPFVWRLELQGGEGTLTWAQGTRSARAPAPCEARGPLLESSVPSSFFTGRGVYLEAYTALGSVYVDHTVTATVR